VRSVFSPRAAASQGQSPVPAFRQTSQEPSLLGRWIGLKRWRNISLLHQAATGASRVRASLHFARRRHQDFTGAEGVLATPPLFFSNRHFELPSLAKFDLPELTTLAVFLES
jgi:hypothetical protein